MKVFQLYLIRHSLPFKQIFFSLDFQLSDLLKFAFMEIVVPKSSKKAIKNTESNWYNLHNYYLFKDKNTDSI